jgi:hypothetical protein
VAAGPAGQQAFMQRAAASGMTQDMATQMLASAAQQVAGAQAQ